MAGLYESEVARALLVSCTPHCLSTSQPLYIQRAASHSPLLLLNPFVATMAYSNHTYLQEVLEFFQRRQRTEHLQKVSNGSE